MSELLEALLDRQENYLNRSLDLVRRATVFIVSMGVIIILLGALASLIFFTRKDAIAHGSHYGDLAASLFFMALLLFVLTIFIYQHSYSSISYYYDMFNQLKGPIDNLSAIDANPGLAAALQNLAPLKRAFFAAKLSETSTLIRYLSVFMAIVPSFVLYNFDNSGSRYFTIYLIGSLANFILQQKLAQSLNNKLANT